MEIAHNRQRLKQQSLFAHLLGETCAMCLAVPGRVLSVEDGDPAFRSACVDFCGIRKNVNLAFTPEVRVGDYVLVHVGFALTRVDEEEAQRTFAYLEQIGLLKEELDGAGAA